MNTRLSKDPLYKNGSFLIDKLILFNKLNGLKKSHQQGFLILVGDRDQGNRQRSMISKTIVNGLKP